MCRRAIFLLSVVLVSCMQRPEPSTTAASGSMLLPQEVDFTVFNGGHNTWGYIDLTGEFLIKARFEAAQRFSEDFAVVCNLKGRLLARKVPKYGFIKRSGDYLIEPQFDDARSFKNGLAAVEIGKKWGFIDRMGKIAIPAQYDDVGEFIDGLAPAVIGGHGWYGMWGYLEPSGGWAIESKFDGARPFSEGLAAVWTGAVWRVSGVTNIKSGGGWGYIDRTGKLVIPARFHEVQPFHEGLAVAAELGTLLHGYLDKSGRWKIAPQFGHTGWLDKGRAVVQVTDDTKRPRKPHWGVIDTDGRFVTDLKFSDLSAFLEGLAQACEYGRKCGYIDESGRYAIEPQFASGLNFSEGLAAVNERPGMGFGYIDRTGKFAIPSQFSKAEEFRNGVARIEIHERIAYVTRQGKILPPSAAKP